MVPRTADLYRLVSGARRWYLVAWDVERQDWRTYRVDQMTLTPPHGARFAPRPPPAQDMAGYMTDGLVRMTHTVSATVVLRTSMEEAPSLITGMDWTLEPSASAAACCGRGPTRWRRWPVSSSTSVSTSPSVSPLN